MALVMRPDSVHAIPGLRPEMREILVVSFESLAKFLDVLIHIIDKFNERKSMQASAATSAKPPHEYCSVKRSSFSGTDGVCWSGMAVSAPLEQPDLPVNPCCNVFNGQRFLAAPRPRVVSLPAGFDELQSNQFRLRPMPDMIFIRGMDFLQTSCRLLRSMLRSLAMI
jgi:hypothetical protein